MDDIVGRLQSLFSAFQLDLLIGSLLGDGRLECRSVGLRHRKTSRFRVHHGNKQSAYVNWKFDVMKDMTTVSPREITRHDRKRDIFETSYYFHTRSTPELGDLHGYFYREGKKILPHDVHNFFNPRVLAVWFMDDGSNNGSTATLNTHNFSVDEHVSIIDSLQNIYSIRASMVKDRTKYKLAFNQHEFEKLKDIVREFIIPEMQYKIVYPRNDFAQHNAVQDRVHMLAL